MPRRVGVPIATSEKDASTRTRTPSRCEKGCVEGYAYPFMLRKWVRRGVCVPLRAAKMDASRGTRTLASSKTDAARVRVPSEGRETDRSYVHRALLHRRPSCARR